MKLRYRRAGWFVSQRCAVNECCFYIRHTVYDAFLGEYTFFAGVFKLFAAFFAVFLGFLVQNSALWNSDQMLIFEINTDENPHGRTSTQTKAAK